MFSTNVKFDLQGHLMFRRGHQMAEQVLYVQTEKR